jgi:hypothetical protein
LNKTSLLEKQHWYFLHSEWVYLNFPIKLLLKETIWMRKRKEKKITILSWLHSPLLLSIWIYTHFARNNNCLSLGHTWVFAPPDALLLLSWKFIFFLFHIHENFLSNQLLSKTRVNSRPLKTFKVLRHHFSSSPSLVTA